MTAISIKPPAVAGAFMAAALASPAHAGNYKFTTLDLPGASAAYVQSLNSSGEVAGVYTTSDGMTHGFTWTKGVFSTFNGAPKRPDVAAVLVNDQAALAVEDTKSGQGWGHLYLRQLNGKQHYLAIAGARFAALTAFNNAGAVAGAYYNASNEANPQTFIDQGGNLQFPAFPGASQTYVTAINNAGLVAGNMVIPGRQTAGFIYQNGAYTAMLPPGAIGSEVRSVNDAGIVAGFFQTGETEPINKAFIYANGVYTVIADPHYKTFDTIASYAVSAQQVIGLTYSGATAYIFNYVNGRTYNFLPPGAVSLAGLSVNSAGTLAGNYVDVGGAVQLFVATCAASPCLK